MDKIFTVKEVSEYLALTEETVRVKLRKKEIIGTKIGRGWRITEKNLNKYMEEDNYE